MKKIIAAVSLTFICIGAFAQNLNPTVDITNTYKSGAGEGTKYVPDQVLPDSLTMFNYNFDYSVFDAPYKGSFEFTPYSVNFNPEPALAPGSKLFVKAGAGYSFHPVLQAIWNPISAERFKMNVHQDLKGYVGRYRTVRRDINSYPMMTTRGDFYNGYDLSELLGVDGNFNIGGAVDGEFSVDYNGIFTKDEVGAVNFNSALAKVAVGSDAWEIMGLKGKLTLDFAGDRIPAYYDESKINQGGFDFDFTMQPHFKGRLDMLFDVKLKYVGYKGAEDFASNYFGFAVTPHVKVQLQKVKLDLGLRLDGAGKLMVAPAINVSYPVLGDALDIYAGLTGGTKFNTVSEFVRNCHWYNPLFSETMTNSFERVNARLGLRGSLFSKLQYDLNGGWASEVNMPVWGVNDMFGELLPCMCFRNVNYGFVNLMLNWKSERFDADGALNFRKSQLNGVADVFDLPLFTGNFRAKYNWDKRIFAGASVAFSTPRKAVVSDVEMCFQPYIDLGLFGEYRLNSRWSFWLQAANLLNEAIQTAPMHVESGVNFTVGACLSL